jgi:hypothetical protein
MRAMTSVRDDAQAKASSMSATRRAVVCVLAAVIGFAAVAAVPELLPSRSGSTAPGLSWPGSGMVMVWAVATGLVAALASSVVWARRASAPARVFGGSLLGAAAVAFALHLWMVRQVRSAYLTGVEESASTFRPCLKDRGYAELCLTGVHPPSFGFASLAMALVLLVTALALVPGRVAWPLAGVLGVAGAVPGMIRNLAAITPSDVEVAPIWPEISFVPGFALVGVAWWVRSRYRPAWVWFVLTLVLYVGVAATLVIVSESVIADYWEADGAVYMSGGDVGNAVLAALLPLMIIGTHIAWWRQDRPHPEPQRVTHGQAATPAG